MNDQSPIFPDDFRSASGLLDGSVLLDNGQSRAAAPGAG